MSSHVSAKPYRCLAFYLPQFHPIPENDRWWGKGYTDWLNVARTTPRFPGHYQPHLPTELGFYDLRLSEVRVAQAELASAHGIDGFVYYHYWFAGRRVLNRPLDELLASGRPDFPFCLCWANESWSRRWGPTYGSSPVDPALGDVLIQQQYSEQDHLAHIRWLAQVFADRRYIRVDGRPLFMVFRASLLPDPPRVAELWRREAQRLGIGDIYLCMVQAFSTDRVDPRSFGFDAGVPFQPDPGLRERAVIEAVPASEHLFSYARAVELALAQAPTPYTSFPCLMPGWDNAPRRPSGATIYVGSTPDLYETWLAGIVRRGLTYGSDENFVFVNAWNEWAEGCHLEPDLRWGRGYLEAHLRAIRQTARAATIDEQPGRSE